MVSEGNRYSFIANYFDQQANMARQYQLLFYPFDNSVEMYDIKNKRLFLKRVKYPQLSLKELFVGASVTIFSRVLKLIDFGDEVTRRQFAENEEALICLVGEDAYNAGNVLELLHSQELRIINLRMADPYGEVEARGIKERFIAIHVGGSGVEGKLSDLKTKYRAQLFISSADIAAMNPYIFNNETSATLKNCAVCVIKPHAIGSGNGGPILQRILDEGFVVTALGLFTLSIADAQDFLEVYKGVVPEYNKLVDQMSSAGCWALELRAENAVSALRAVCGPHDPEVCRILFPHTIRSKFGIDRVMNGVHCTDLVEDGPLESEFFFQLMLNKA